METKTPNTQESPTEAKPLLAAGAFSRLGKHQKEIINKIVIDDYYILKTLDTRDMTTFISLIDEYGNYDRDLSEKELQSLYNRGFLIKSDVSRCIELQQEKFLVDEQFVEELLNACC